jgi:hypothetical protein
VTGSEFVMSTDGVVPIVILDSPGNCSYSCDDDDLIIVDAVEQNCSYSCDDDDDLIIVDAVEQNCSYSCDDDDDLITVDAVEQNCIVVDSDVETISSSSDSDALLLACSEPKYNTCVKLHVTDCHSESLIPGSKCKGEHVTSFSSNINMLVSEVVFGKDVSRQNMADVRRASATLTSSIKLENAQVSEPSSMASQSTKSSLVAEMSSNIHVRADVCPEAPEKSVTTVVSYEMPVKAEQQTYETEPVPAAPEVAQSLYTMRMSKEIVDITAERKGGSASMRSTPVVSAQATVTKLAIDSKLQTPAPDHSSSADVTGLDSDKNERVDFCEHASWHYGNTLDEAEVEGCGSVEQTNMNNFQVGNVRVTDNRLTFRSSEKKCNSTSWHVLPSDAESRLSEVVGMNVDKSGPLLTTDNVFTGMPSHVLNEDEQATKTVVNSSSVSNGRYDYQTVAESRDSYSSRPCKAVFHDVTDESSTTGFTNKCDQCTGLESGDKTSEQGSVISVTKSDCVGASNNTLVDAPMRCKFSPAQIEKLRQTIQKAASRTSSLFKLRSGMTSNVENTVPAETDAVKDSEAGSNPAETDSKVINQEGSAVVSVVDSAPGFGSTQQKCFDNQTNLSQCELVQDCDVSRLNETVTTSNHCPELQFISGMIIEIPDFSFISLESLRAGILPRQAAQFSLSLSL